ncbi:MAG: hypothetical protein HFH84_05910 [Lachnospiraceae bacterium]|nr:hypothetical protein [Lachnospiraceae bacterium]
MRQGLSPSRYATPDRKRSTLLQGSIRFRA